MYPKYLKACRICGSHSLAEIIDLGDQYLQGSFVKEGVIEPPRRKLPTRLVRCDVEAGGGCGLVQLAHTFPPAVLYTNYWYRSGTNQTMRDHLRGVVESALDVVGRSGTSLTVVDIGCNDGTLLSYYPDGTRLYGVDPSDIAQGIDLPITLVNAMFPSEETKKKFQGLEFDVVTSIAIFYDLEEPTDFARHVASLLSKNGVWIIELSYLPLMLLNNSFDTICHEHIEYYSLAVLEYLLAEAGLRVFRAEINDINGGSIRCFVCHKDINKFDTPEHDLALRRLRLMEFDMALDAEKPYAAFRQRVAELRDESKALLKSLKHQGQTIHVYGASTKGNVLLQYYEIDNTLIEAAADRNLDKVGAKTLGSNIPIISEEESRRMGPKFYLVLPWHFQREFLRREYDMIRNGVTFIFPLPKITFVNRDNVDKILQEIEEAPDSIQQRMFELVMKARR
ncbi:MAG TPA: class I SAM-dependent methyltransferase [Desulfomonilaceae bacterium]|nr:class I SAM-dependent methyltransferase [Desulfomonilaceae bacterium]